MINLELNDLIKRAQGGRSQNQFAMHCEISSAALTKIIKGERRPKPDLLRKIALRAYNNITYDQLMQAAGFLERKTRAGHDALHEESEVSAKLGAAADNKSTVLYESVFVRAGSIIKVPKDNIELEFSLPERAFAALINDDSLSGIRIRKGDIAIVDQSRQPAEGEVGLFALGGQKAVARKYHSDDTGNLTLYAENPNFEPIKVDGTTEYYVIGKIIKVIFNIS